MSVARETFTRILSRAVLACASGCLLVGCPDDDDDIDRDPEPGTSTVALDEMADGFTAPVLLREAPDDTDRLFVVDQVGTIHVLMPDGEVLDEPFLDLRDSLVELMDSFDERGLLGLAFHPDYEENGRLFVYYSAPLRDEAPEDYNHTGRVSEFTVSDDDENQVDRDSERVILEVDQPQFNHNGGTLAFGPEDGLLYVSLGDGGGANDVGEGHPEQGNGQDITTLLGSILRIDVDDTEGDEAYTIPEDNPFVDEEGRDEIYAYGFRNPYRASFDIADDHELFAGDVGQDRWEEVVRVKRGGNHGWHIREGTRCFDPDNPTDPPESCPDEGPRGERLIPPLVEYLNANAPDGIGLAVVGGYVYRGDELPSLEGEYVFGDYSADGDQPEGRLFAARPDDDHDDHEDAATDGDATPWSMRELSVEGRPDDELGAFLLGLGQDNEGEIYVLTSQEPGPTGTTGEVYRMVRADNGEMPADAGADADAGDAGADTDDAGADTDAGMPGPGSGDAGMPEAGPDDAGTDAAEDAAMDAVAQQLQLGAMQYADHCARCHGDDGTGTDIAPPLVGEDALPVEPPESRTVRTSEFHTAADVFAFTSENMPADDPGSLPTQTYVDILAFALDANGIELSEPLTVDNADTIDIQQ